MKDLIKKYLQEQVIDNIGETRPYIDPDFIDVYADDIEELVKLFAIPDVVGRSEQLKAFAEMVAKDDFAYLKDAETLLEDFESL